MSAPFDQKAGLSEALRAIDEFAAQMQRHMEVIAQAFQPIMKAIDNAMGPALETFQRIAEIDRECKALEAAGWLPHCTSPRHLIITQLSIEPGALGEQVEEYYKKNWPEIREHLEKKIASYSIDEEAKEGFKQALSAHEGGLYRLVSRGLFPEIERVTRLELHNHPREKITSQESLREIAGHLYLTDMEPGGLYGLALYGRFVNHVYRHVDDVAYSELASDHVPNRHATMHGYFSYNTAQCSLNAIFMTDYIFQIIHLAKAARQESDSAKAA